MRKYLINGALALFAGAFVLGCADKEQEYVPVIQQKVKVFEDVFKEAYGDIDPYQNWGFTNQIVLADESTTEVVYVDSLMSEPFAASRARTREENANANEWADPTKAYGGLMVPPPLTDKQIAVVKKYFQTVKGGKYEDPHWTNYFIQQVYKGGSAPLSGTNPTYNQPYSPEKYEAVDGQTKIVGSDHMDYLAAINGTFVDDINNFNHGDCSKNHDVLDNGSYVNGGTYHKDKIMYMKNSTTVSFGYYNSNGSVRRTEYTKLVSYKTIMQALGAEADCLDDSWNRSFMGFDFEQMVDDECYATEWVNNKEVAKNLTIWGDYIINGETKNNYVYKYKGESVKMLSDQMNRYCGDKRTVTDEQLYTDLYDAANNNAYIGKRLNTSVIDGLLDDGYLPVDNKSLREWVKVGGCADGYYSDWIVTLTEAKGRTSHDEPDPKIEKRRIPVTTQSGRIFCEDLGVSTREDLDFNDVVFDVKVYKNFEEGNIYTYTVYSDGVKELTKTEPYSTEKDATYTCEIILQAAGGTIPITVADQDVHNAFRQHSKNNDIGMTTMINTYDANSTAFGQFAECSEVNLGVLLGKPNGEFTPTDLFAKTNKASKYSSDKVCIEAIDIPIVVNYDNGVAELGSTLGGAPAKIFVPNYTTKWTVERKPLSLAYPKFAGYVGNKNINWWDDSDLSTYLANQGLNSDAVSKAVEEANYCRHGNNIGSSTTKSPIVITRFIYPSSSEQNLWTSEKYGEKPYGSWSLNDLNLDFKTFYAGDRIRFYANNLQDDSYITVVYADGSKPYLIDCSFPNFEVDSKGNLKLDANGNKIRVSSGYIGVIEVVLDEENAEKMNSTVQKYGTIQVQGRHFNLKKIGRVLFQ